MEREYRPKTFAEHREYLYEIVKLQLFFVHLWLEKHPEDDFRYVLEHRVNIYRKTDANPESAIPKVLHFDESPWADMANAAHEIYLKRRDDRAAFEREAFEVFRDSLDGRAERDYGERPFCGVWQFGCLRSNPAPSEDGRLGFHIGNPISPLSFFDDPAYLKSCFLALLDVAEKVMGVKEISTRSWLNSYPRWLAWFPQEWLDHMSEPNPEVKWHAGFWGQFITARGTFSYRRAEILRRTGEFPYGHRYSFASIAAMRKKLAEIESA